MTKSQLEFFRMLDQKIDAVSVIFWFAILRMLRLFRATFVLRTVKKSFPWCSQVIESSQTCFARFPSKIVLKIHGTYSINLSECRKSSGVKRAFHKLTSVFYASVLLLMINCVITLSKWLWNHEPQASGSAINFDNVMTKFIINKRTDA